MAQENVFREAIGFLDKIGVYDVILPFLLVFTITFAILEKTKILGVEKIEEKEYTKKNLNTVVAFCVAFIVIASTRLVSVISTVMSHVVLLLMLAISFLLLVGVFFGDKEFTLKDFPGWVKFFMFAMIFAIVLIFLSALEWITPILEFFQDWNSEWVATVVLLLIVVGFIGLVVFNPFDDKKDKKEDD